MSIAAHLFERRSPKARWVYLLAAIPFVIFGLIGYDYGAAPLYAVPAILCLVQFLHPTMFLWYAFFGVFIAADALYLSLAFSDLFKFASGERPKVFVDADDSAGFALLIVTLLVVTAVLFRARPNRKQLNKDEKQPNQAL